MSNIGTSKLAIIIIAMKMLKAFVRKDVVFFFIFLILLGSSLFSKFFESWLVRLVN